ncbi:MAG: ribonuclease HII [Pyrinomonadaceae bacterium]|nr:ribonuclease HII [Pyrinomonadaceae bacterium]
MIGLDFENRASQEGYKCVAGVDEVGRGCLAGPVVAGAVILNRSKALPEGLNDSKKISKKKRETLAAKIKECALGYAVGQIEADEIDQINILEATKKAMGLAIRNLQVEADFLLIDALELKNVVLPQKGIIKGDSISASIAAASIIAKVYRDKLMKDYAETYPAYGFERHAGYGTQAHFLALRKNGVTPIHRKSFKGVSR